MSKKPRFFIVDVFGEERYSGNQLAVFLETEHLSDSEMQKLAREINFSETTFVLNDPPENGGYNVRIFTPEKEIEFAGHPTLGTAFVIQQHIIGRRVDRIDLELKAGRIPVYFADEDVENATLWMDQIEPEFGDSYNVDVISDILTLHENDIDTRYPVQEVSTGLPHIIVPVVNLEALKTIKIERDRYFHLVDPAWAKCILAFSPEGYNESHDVAARMFADYFGVPEDPATGSGIGCLAAYLVKHDYFQSDTVDLKAGQGYEVGRPSLLMLKAHQEDEKIAVSVGGKVVSIAEGRLV
ncbi:MAG: PhzF family phenazine biosynthesis protein [Proteobacteria bacterium]|nr:PhzF family phenazine biosynthesis protein [Pseudomonadota bacterium]